MSLPASSPSPAVPRFLSSSRGLPPHSLTTTDEARLHYSLLPVIARADNVRLPTGPFPDLQTIRARARSRAAIFRELGGRQKGRGRIDGDDLVPFFVSAPPERDGEGRARPRRTGEESVPPALEEEEDLKEGSGGSRTPSSIATTTVGRRFSLQSGSFSSPTSTAGTGSTRRSSGTSSRPHLGHGLALNLNALTQISQHEDEGDYALDLDSAPPSPRTMDRILGDRKYDPTRPIGFLLPAVAKAMVEDNARMERSKMRPCWRVVWMNEDDVGERLMGRLKGLGGSGGEKQEQDEVPCAIAFEDWVNEEGAEGRKEHVDRLVRTWKESGLFKDVLKGWTDREYTVYAAPDLSSLPSRPQNLSHLTTNPLPSAAFTLERSAVSLFSFLQFGVNMTAFVPLPTRDRASSTTPSIAGIWVFRRPAWAHKWPQYLDNTVTLDLSTDELHSPAVALQSACVERQGMGHLPFPLPTSASPSPSASPNPEHAAGATLDLQLHPAGGVSYAFSGPTSDECPDGFVEVVVKYVYDLAVPAPEGFLSPTRSQVASPARTPLRDDHEVDYEPGIDDLNGAPPMHDGGAYSLMSVDAVIDSLKRGEFTPDAGVAIVDFLVRHGVVRPETDQRYWEVCSRSRNGFAGAVVVP